ncbi:MAG TPA: elongation factor 1-beta [Nanoarchaeota archaeon]|nr:elongation factor 1-beta [Nanoarchaeota archaeon]
MGKVAMNIKIMPCSAEIDIEKLSEEIKKTVEVKDLKIEPIAFGLKAIKILVIVDDSEGSEKIENKIKSVKGVGEVEIESVTLL